MKKLICILLLNLLTSGLYAQNIEELKISGEIKAANNSFDVQMEISDISKGAIVPIIKGDVALRSLHITDERFSLFPAFITDKNEVISKPKWISLQREASGYSLKIDKTIKKDDAIKIKVTFVSKTVNEHNRNSTTVWLPMATIRKLELSCPKDTSLTILNASKITTKQLEPSIANGVTNAPNVLYSTNLGGNNYIKLFWKPKMKVLRKELSVACDMKTLVKANVGVMQIVNDYNFNIIQGRLRELKFDLPKDLNVTRVNGSNIQDWHIEDKQSKVLCVNLTQSYSGMYNIQVEAEKMLGSLPFETSVPAIQPQNVIRCGGMLLLGTDNSLKLGIENSSLINQIDNTAFPTTSRYQRFMPRQKLYAYQFANMPYGLAIKIDNVVPVIDVENYSVIQVKEGEIGLKMSLQLEVKDTPIISLDAVLKNSSDWIITSITGHQVSEIDSDCRKAGADQKIDVKFTKPIFGTTQIIIKAEKVVDQNQEISIPTLEIKASKNQRGYLIMSADKGIQLEALKSKNLREIHTGSSPIKVTNTQKSYRFKNADWQMTIQAKKNTANVYCEAFHLSSFGEGVVYKSVAFTYFISGSPVNEISLKIPVEISNIEITGANIERWKRTGDVCKIKLNTPIMDDYTFLVTYDEQFDYKGDKLAIGRISTLNTANEIGYLVVSSAAALQIENLDKIPLNVIKIGRDELPAEYAAPVTAPILNSYKYTKHQHALTLEVKPLKTEALLTQLADYVSLYTKIGERGGVETTATYYLKNTSRQFLVLKPPAGAKPWHAKLKLPDGKVKNIVMQQKDDCWLLPVERPSNPNDILTVSVTYAQQLPPLTFWNTSVKGIDLTAPKLVDTDAVYMGWRIAMNDKSIALKSGNMYDSRAQDNVLTKSFENLGRYHHRNKILSLFKTIWPSMPINDTISLVRSVNPANAPSAQVKICIKPTWLGKSGNLISMIVWFVIATLALIIAIILKNKIMMAMALTLFGMSLVKSEIGCRIVLVLVAIIIVFAILKLVFLWFKRLTNTFKTTDPTCQEKQAAKQKQDDFMDDLDIIEEDQEEVDQSQDIDTENQNAGGFVNLKLLLFIIGMQLIFVTGTAFAQKSFVNNQSQDIFINSIEVELQAKNAADIQATFEYKIKANKAGAISILPKEYIVTDYELDSKKVKLNIESGFYTIKTEKKGDFTVTVKCAIPAHRSDSAYYLKLFLAPSFINQVKLELYHKNLDVSSSQAVDIKSTEKDDKTFTKMTFGAEREVKINWQPRKRQVELEKTVIFADLNTSAKIKSGVLENLHKIEMLIVQGESSSLQMLIPKDNNVTSVEAEELSTWRFDSNSRKLEVVFSKPQSGSATIKVTTQNAIASLPCNLEVSVPLIENIARQRGAIVIESAHDVQFNVESTAGVSIIDSKDFDHQQNMIKLSIAKKYRYNLPQKVALELSVAKVLPEIISREETSISVSDDKIEVSSRLDLQVNKAGVFEIEFLIPADYEPELITGAYVNHWNDSNTTNNQRLIKVNFKQKVLGKTKINILLTRIVNSLPKDFMVPKIKLMNTRKQTGRVTIIAEKGLRLTLSEPEGIDVRLARSVQVYQEGALVFDILRQNWSAKLSSEVLAPIIRPEVLLWVNLDDGILQYNSYLNYQIENAGIKVLTFQSPKPDAALTFSGSGIANVNLIDKTKGIWQVTLNGKVENKYNLRVTWQEPYQSDAAQINIKPLKTLNTQPQRGYLAVTCKGRIQIETQGDLSDLKVDDARNIPSSFGAQGLSDAIFCYRTLQPHYNLAININRNQAAKVLPATINDVHVTAVLDDDKKMIATFNARINVGDLNLLRIKLPNEGKIWTALVDDKEVSVSREGDYFCLPLEKNNYNSHVNVSLSYSGNFKIERNHYLLDIPTLKDIPMKNIQVTLALSGKHKYYDFGGTLEFAHTFQEHSRFDTSQYIDMNSNVKASNLKRAREILGQGERMMKDGDVNAARQAFSQAYNYSMGSAGLNEDARVQMNKVNQQQIKVGLYNRRQAVRYDNNFAVNETQGIINKQLISQAGAPSDLNFTAKQYQQIEDDLADVNATFDLVANKIVEQQAAAATVIKGVKVTLPKNGKILTFTRYIQSDPESPLSISFKVKQSDYSKLLVNIVAILAFSLLIWGTFFFKFGQKA